MLPVRCWFNAVTGQQANMHKISHRTCWIKAPGCAYRMLRLLTNVLFHATTHCTKQQGPGFAGMSKELHIHPTDSKAANAHIGKCKTVAAGFKPVAWYKQWLTASLEQAYLTATGTC
jgi:hypothetical protein